MSLFLRLYIKGSAIPVHHGHHSFLNRRIISWWAQVETSDCPIEETPWRGGATGGEGSWIPLAEGNWGWRRKFMHRTWRWIEMGSQEWVLPWKLSPQPIDSSIRAGHLQQSRSVTEKVRNHIVSTEGQPGREQGVQHGMGRSAPRTAPAGRDTAWGSWWWWCSARGSRWPHSNSSHGHSRKLSRTPKNK